MKLFIVWNFGSNYVILQAEEESDDIDEGREVDYMTDTDSEDEDMYTDNVKTDKYEEKGSSTCLFVCY